MNNSLLKLQENNPSVKLEELEGKIKVSHLWNDDTFICLFDQAQELLQLENIVLPEELVAIFHKDKNMLEYIFAPLSLSERFLARRFSFNYKNQDFNCYFSESSKSLEILASSFKVVSEQTDSRYRNLRMFRDYYKKEKPDYIKEYFKGKKAFSFCIAGDMALISYDLVSLSKHLNFYMDFFDRRTPTIMILNKNVSSEAYSLPCYSLFDQFPQSINAREINPIILDIFSVAHATINIRLRYLFYFQVLEYCSYYYLNDDLKKKIGVILKNPDISNKLEHYSKFMVDQFKDYFRQNDDSVKLEKTICDFCSLDDLKLELKENIGYFCKDITFDGGFVLDAILDGSTSLDNPSNSNVILKNIKDNIEKIRNVLVHLRESRENKIILPTEKNDNLLKPYLYLLKRISEKVAIQFE